MRLRIYGMSFRLTSGIVEHVQDRVQRSLAAPSGTIDTVIVRLSDINGARGGADKLCRIVAQGRHVPALVVEASDADLYVAVDEATLRARDAVRRHVKRRRTLRREYAQRSLRRLVG